MTKKILTRVKLINWHYFENETLYIKGTTLLSGENTAGKSTILDAIQFCLTTDERNFNKAANEGSQRKLKGYVRCKTGTEGETYLRKGSVPSYIVLEYFEEKENRYFVLGVYIFSRDDDADLDKKWFILDNCRFEDLSFFTDDGKTPALSKQFLFKGEKISYIENKSSAKDRIKARLGYLGDRFFELIPKAISFKPVKSVKEFINNYVLSEEKIEIDNLRQNVENLSELEDALEKSRKQLSELVQIAQDFEKIDAKENEIKINENLLKIASFNASKNEIDDGEKFIKKSEQDIFEYEKKLNELSGLIIEIGKKITALNVDKENNNANAQLKSAEERIKHYESEMKQEELRLSKFKNQVEKIKEYLIALQKCGYSVLTREEMESLNEKGKTGNKRAALEKLIRFNDEKVEVFQEEFFSFKSQIKNLENEITIEENKLKELENNKSTYPNPSIKKLKELIEQEFNQNGIKSEVYVLCELLEINDANWADAVEAYFNTQKFNLLVEPQYYNLALEVYSRNKRQLHSVGIINTKKLPEVEIEENSLATVVESSNSNAKKYADYILGRVIRCENILDLENHQIAITSDCCLYQGYVSKYLNPATYKEPYIGQKAKKIQRKNSEKIIKEKKEELENLRNKKISLDEILSKFKNIDFSIATENADASEKLSFAQTELAKAQSDFDAANNNPDLIRIINEIESAEKVKQEYEKEQLAINTKKTTLKKDVQDKKDFIATLKNNTVQIQIELDELEKSDFVLFKSAQDKYEENRKTKTAKTILDNFSPVGSRLENEKNKFLDELKEKQYKFNNSFALDFKTGLEEKEKYFEIKSKLESVEILAFQEKIVKNKKDCEEIFKLDFISKMKELIENAKSEFKNLNKALSGIEYGDDTYVFEIGSKKDKESLYKMIMSDSNVEGDSLWTSSFEDEYKQEMDELFSKLTVSDEAGMKVLSEYTDYRSYLDFEIIINKKNGTKQKLSKVLSEKSGGETQVPFYIAIAASFYQLYSTDNSVRLMLLDEAFNNMDSERIKSVMELFKKLELQILLVAPSPKIEDIGEHVDSILTAIRDDHYSYVEEYDL